MSESPSSAGDSIPSGLLILDKPVGIASTRMLYRIRGITRVRKSGHAGTLDPQASGVLVLCLGRATKLVESIMCLPKVYRATSRLDVTNAGYDLEMELEPVEVAHPPSFDQVAEAARRLEGRIMQEPPIYSAVKVGGRPAYKLALENKIDRLDPKPVTVYWIAIRRYQWPQLDFDLACGRGTYVRSLIRDFGTHLGTGGCLTSLRRLAVGPFDVNSAHQEETVRDRPLSDVLIPLTQARRIIDQARDTVPARPA